MNCASGVRPSASITFTASATSSRKRRLRCRPTTSASATTSPMPRSSAAFEMAAALGAPLITSSSNIKTVARVAPVAARHKMLVGVHNHSRIDPNEFATAKSLTDALAASRFIAVNLDIGHFTAANEDAVAFLKQHHDRIVTLHLKDRKRNQGDNVPFGRRRHADHRRPQAAAGQRLADSREYRIRIQGRRQRGRGGQVPRLLPEGLELIMRA